ncbi:MAG: N-acetylmuramoyl-L-alanine amidase [Chitinophagaceae bacterium]
MKISKHILFGNDGKRVNYIDTPNKSGLFATGFPKYLVMHYTAATTAQSAISWFANKKAKASAHLLIARDGSITQFAPFNSITWHAGESQWSGLVGLNKYSIGIELVNAGRLQKTQTNWICSVDKKIIPANEVMIAKHKNENAESAWQTYTDIQLQVSIEVASLLLKTYALTDIVGHEDIAPFRKSDPGPAFPMGSFRSKAMGRKETTLNIFTTSTQVNIRAGAGTQFSQVSDPLPTGTKVSLLKRDGNWSFVEVLQKINGVNDVEGWVASKFLIQ